MASSAKIKTLVYPVAENEISLRIANLHDHFDDQMEPIEFDVKQFAIDYYNASATNFGEQTAKPISEILIDERTLTGVQNYKSGTQNFHQLHWQHKSVVSLKLLVLERNGLHIPPNEEIEAGLPQKPEDPDLAEGKIVLEG